MDIWDSMTSVDPSLLMASKRNDDSDPYWTTKIGCGCPRSHVLVQTQGPEPFAFGHVKILGFGRGPPPLADPYTNSFRVESICTVNALYSLGLHIGATEEMLCAEESISPFFRSSAESADDTVKAKVTGTVQRIFNTIKPDLRPNQEQVSVKHHVYIDILPFPTLRKNLITQQDKFDEDEFFHDLIPGLVCWGRGGMGNRDRREDCSNGYVPTGTPWDARSWEATAWFLKKYWYMLGGEDGELVRQSEWWRAMRGDDTPVVPDLVTPSIRPCPA